MEDNGLENLLVVWIKRKAKGNKVPNGGDQDSASTLVQRPTLNVRAMCVPLENYI